MSDMSGFGQGLFCLLIFFGNFAGDVHDVDVVVDDDADEIQVGMEPPVTEVR